MSLQWILLAGVVLACPAMMYFMMRGGSHGPSHGDAGGSPEDARDREIRAQKGRLEELESRWPASSGHGEA